MTELYYLVPLGFAVGAYGTLIGAGGGFVLVPLLLLLYPHEKPEIITSISLAVVFFNALSGSWAYARQKRIHYRSALIFAAAAIPGAVLGALSTASVPRRLFDGILGLLMLAAAIALIWFTAKEQAVSSSDPSTNNHDASQENNEAQYRTGIGTALSAVVGYVSALLGLGGGIVHVPLLSRVVRMPVHVATATSHLILAIMAAVGTIVHIASGNFHHGIRRTIALSVGVIVGAQLGAYFSGRLHGRWIERGLAAALALVGLRVLLLAWSPLEI